jgi:hypothetical protein
VGAHIVPILCGRMTILVSWQGWHLIVVADRFNAKGWIAELGSARHNLEKLGNQPHTKGSVTRAIGPRTFMGKVAHLSRVYECDMLLPILRKDRKRSVERN